MLSRFLLILALIYSLSANSADYLHPNSWEGACATGHQQSPINIITSSVVPCSKSKFKISFWNGTTTVSPTLGAHSSLKSDFPTSFMTIVDSRGKLLQYMAQQYHMHAPSEHTINGVLADLEIHLVHALNKDIFQDTNTYAVLGLMFKQIPDDSTETTLFESIDFTSPTQKINFNMTIGTIVDKENIFHYEGSFTTPLCNEIVNWYVVQNIYHIKKSQLDAIKAQLNDGEANNRPVQPLNSRVVEYITPTCNSVFSFIVTKQMSGFRAVPALLLVLLLINTLF